MNRQKIGIWIAGLSAALLVSVLAAGYARPGLFQQTADDLYQAALMKKEAEGDLAGAIKAFQEILEKFPGMREVAAKSQLQIGLCYEKLGAKEAEKAFQKVIDNYPEQSEAVRKAKEKLSLLLRTRILMKQGDREFKLRQIWAGPEVDILGDVSPDGKYLSFVDWETGDLAIRDLAAGTNRRLTNKGPWTQLSQFALFSRWAPDSRRVLYQWYDKDEIFELRVVDIMDPAPRILFQHESNMKYVQPFDWSPDGKNVLAGFWSAQGPGEEGKTQLGLISVKDGTVKILRSDFEVPYPSLRPWGFAFSPDGKFIAYDMPRKDQPSFHRDIYLLPVDGGPEIPLVEHPAADVVIDWTPDGKGLLFISDRTGTRDMWLIRMNDGRPKGNPELIKTGVGSMRPMGITSGGTLFYGVQGGATDVYEVGIEPQTGKILSPAKKAVLLFEGQNAYPDYSSDGTRLAYISGQASSMFQSRTVRKALSILSLKSGQVRELIPDLSSFDYPRWAPNGKVLSVEASSRENRVGGIYQIDVETAAVLPIVQIENNMVIFSHRWSRDGKRIYYSTGERNRKSVSLFVHDLESGKDAALFGSPDDACDIDISPDGKWLALLNRGDKRSLRIIPTAGGNPREIYGFEHEANHILSPAWSADGRYIYFPVLQKSQKPPGDMFDLYRVPAAGGEPQKIEVAMGRMRHFTVHPDGQRIAFSSRGTNPEKSEVWVMEDFFPGGTEKK
ncbi:MAG: tetratricopeptide repeat protein [Acidobacteriota bacterium]|nr:tetratricopeptide repeat protein [Acidobacteriota bacterium]